MLTIIEPVTEVGLYDGDVVLDLSLITSLKQALSIVGGLSKPEKMPCYCYNLPASRCRMGSKLNLVPGSVCHGCYAADEMDWVKRKNAANGKWALTRYTTPSVKGALQRRYESLSDPLWVPAMVYAINHYADRGVNHFRWHDSGDLQDRNHFQNIMMVCSHTPSVNHWLPTREYSIVRGFSFPDNLCVRLSAHMVDGMPPDYGIPTSTVSTGLPVLGVRCNAPSNDGRCGSCRWCWDRSVSNVDYHHHN
jgi:hypothetical protein